MFKSIPGESLEHLLWRLQASAFFVNEPIVAKTKRRKHKIAKLAERLGKEQLMLLIDMMSRATVVVVNATAYTVYRDGLKASVYRDGGEKHTVTNLVGTLECSCKGFKFRGDCNHVRAYAS